MMDERAKKLEAVRLAMCEAAARAMIHIQNDMTVRTLAEAALDAIEPPTEYEVEPGLIMQKSTHGWVFFKLYPGCKPERLPIETIGPAVGDALIRRMKART